MNIIRVEGIELYAHHGCLEEEALIGSHYRVDVEIETDFTEAAKQDDLSKTVDYVAVYQIVRREMKIRAKLIEHVGQRIIDAMKSELTGIKKVRVKVSKLSPPINGNAYSVSIEIEN
jgi:7,8-dihydroneopterin aldolase/epimerase/oxygenase